MTNSLNDITSTSFTLCSDHRSSFCDTSQGLAQVSAAADEWNLELVLVDVVNLVSWGENLALINVVNTNGLQNLGLDKVTDSSLGHHRNGNSLADLLDHLRVTHAGHSAVLANIRRDALKSHDGNSAGLLGNASLLGVDDVHDDATLKHLRKADLDCSCTLLRLHGTVSVCVSVHSLRPRFFVSVSARFPIHLCVSFHTSHGLRRSR
mmetsp:Transcript_4978/g.8849  ORF Transcript_4978/g.8849 Transcript_4978/m.8849 type:complete len:207 (-) Transcript_4978:40-660(-)